MRYHKTEPEPKKKCSLPGCEMPCLRLSDSVVMDYCSDKHYRWHQQRIADQPNHAKYIREFARTDK